MATWRDVHLYNLGIQPSRDLGIHSFIVGAFDTHYWTSASAFFLTGKDNGSISLIDMTDPYNVGGESLFEFYTFLYSQGITAVVRLIAFYSWTHPKYS